jgi:hypothetical protein
MTTLLLALAGILLLGFSIAAMAYFMPRKGRVHPWVAMPVVDSAIPLTIMTSATMGVAMLVSAFV